MTLTVEYHETIGSSSFLNIGTVDNLFSYIIKNKYRAMPHSAYDRIVSTIKNFPIIIPTKFGSNWHNSFKGKHFLYIGQSETKMSYISHIFCLIIMKRGNFVEDFLNTIPAKFGSYWQNSFRVNNFSYISQSETRMPVSVMFLSNQ